MQAMKILFVASEVAPFAKSGGLADVAGALPKALTALGHDVRVVMPRYYVIDKEKYGLKALGSPLVVDMGDLGKLYAGVYEAYLPHSTTPIYFIEYDDFFGRKGLYDEDGFGFSDNDIRFIFFSKASMELAKMLDFKPDIIHANDWHSAPLAILLNSAYAFDPNFAYTGSLLSIHNLEHQGRFSKEAMNLLGVGWEHFVEGELEEYDGVNLLKGGIVHADAIVAVSQKYAKEICTPEFGFGLQNLLLGAQEKLHGILNGVDYEEWSPSCDTFLPALFDADSLEGKAECKRSLQREFGLPVRSDVALVGLVGRLAEQKGITLIATAFEMLLNADVQIVLLGAGESWAQNFFKDKAKKYPEKFAAYIGYDNRLAHLIEAGSDIFLMPSLFEPCGLNQIYSLRYGTIPLVRATGGLDDTIENYDPQSKSGTGFKFYDATPSALLGTFSWALDVYYNDKAGFATLIQNAMSKRYEWSRAALEYVKVYETIIQRRKHEL